VEKEAKWGEIEKYRRVKGAERWPIFSPVSPNTVVCYTALFSVVTQRSSPLFLAFENITSNCKKVPFFALLKILLPTAKKKSN